MAHLLVVVGWLLTPAWAWAASHVGLWLGALVALRFENPFVMLAIAGAGALLYGRWYNGNQSNSYELRTTTSLGGRFGQGLAAYVIVHDSLGRNRAFYGAGWELQAWRHRQTFAPYVIAGAALGLSTDTARQQ